MSIERSPLPPDGSRPRRSRPDRALAVVGIGASAGGLEACRRLLGSLPVGHGMAFVLVQHLDPTHESLMADLLAGHTAMTVAPASDGDRLEPDHLHLIPPGTDLAVDAGVLRVTRPQARHGPRLPFDFFLKSLARSYGPRAVAVVLSGTGADGSDGVVAVKTAGGFVVVQDPDEAGFDGMPRSAVATGVVDEILSVDEIGPALVDHILRSADLERELDATRQELQGAIRSLEISSEERKASDEEALSANEEFQSTNEELLTSKKELQSLNEELSAPNGQLQETMERHRATSNDLQNVLYSTDVATLFLDTDLNIRFFTPATRSLFAIIASDVGRPLADLRFLADDDALLSDARVVLRNGTPIEREIEAPNDVWFVRRILPYRTHDDGTAGVVVTFVDVTERRHAAEALDAAKRRAEHASLAKSRFLAAANHDLRQPLQTLWLLQGLLEGTVEEGRAKVLVGRLKDVLAAMTGMLDTLLDMNQIESGTVRVEIAEVAVADVLARMSSEFSCAAEAKGLTLRVSPSTRVVRTDRRLLEQMIRNLLANALKYTPRGKVLLGCRRRGEDLAIEVWDTGIGIAADEIQAIFEEYHQIGNPERDRTRGLGLGLSIVRRLGDLLGHRIRVCSRPGRGSVFSIDLPSVAHAAVPSQPLTGVSAAPVVPPPLAEGRVGSILVIEDEPDVRDLLELVLEREGHHLVAVPDGLGAVRLVAEGKVRPDLVLADFNLPGGIDGVEVATRLRELSPGKVPVIILTGDVSNDTSCAIADHDCLRLEKPVKTEALIAAVDRLLGRSDPSAAQS